MKLKDFYILPSHWLFNAGVIGLLEVLENGLSPEEIRKDLLLPEGGLNGYRLMKLVKRYLDEPAPISELPHASKLHWWYLAHPNQPSSVSLDKPKDRLRDVTGKLFSHQGIYGNMISLDESRGKSREENFATEFSCSNIFIKARRISYCYILGETKFSVESLSYKWATYLFPSPGGFPNSFWEGSQEKGTPQVATPIAYLLTCHHLAFTKVSGGVEVFINAPSFRLMYDLNKILRSLDVMGKAPQDILAFSLVGYALRVQRMLTAWTYQNIELIVKSRTSVSSYSLPADVARMLLDAQIGRSLSQLSPKVSTQVLQLLLSRKFGEIEGILYGELRDTLKGERQSSDVKALLQLTGRIREVHKKSLYEQSKV
ncbi:MAG: hypothetical protein NZ989_08960 [Bacteroidia bacterium]|nr:hypothetical protein [Bacteroidia bacterium]